VEKQFSALLSLVQPFQYSTSFGICKPLKGKSASLFPVFGRNADQLSLTGVRFHITDTS